MNGAGVKERLVESDEFKYATSWSADGGRWVAYQSNESG
jgi:hypothetical protein